MPSVPGAGSTSGRTGLTRTVQAEAGIPRWRKAPGAGLHDDCEPMSEDPTSKPPPRERPVGAHRRRQRNDEFFDYLTWTKHACDASGVPLAIEDLLTLKKLSVLARQSDC